MEKLIKQGALSGRYLIKCCCLAALGVCPSLRLQSLHTSHDLPCFSVRKQRRVHEGRSLSTVMALADPLAKDMYHSIPQRDGTILTRCMRGTSALEGFHAGNNKVLSGYNNSPLVADARMLEHMTEVNAVAAKTWR